MDLHDRRALKAAARDSLAAAPYDPRKLILIHTGITIAVSLLGTVINFILAKQIETTGGLGGLGLRSVLSTAQSVLQMLVAIVIPFWEAGYCYATMGIARNKRTTPDALLQGFRQFRPLLRLKLMLGVIYILIGILCMLLSYYIFMLTPLSDPLFAIIENTHLDTTMLQTEILLDDAIINALTRAYIPMMVIWLVLYGAIGILFSYRFRVATFLILDHPEMRAMETLRMSSYQLRGNMTALFKLDLSNLWFYVLSVLATALAYGDYLLASLGVTLVSGEADYFIFLILSLAFQGCLFIWARNRVEVTYAKFYCHTALSFPNQSNEAPC